MMRREDGHIIVELDFVPVEERLPASGWAVKVLREGCRRAVPGYYDAIEATWYWWDEDEDGRRKPIIERVTHWAEIPEVNHD